MSVMVKVMETWATNISNQNTWKASKEYVFILITVGDLQSKRINYKVHFKAKHQRGECQVSHVHHQEVTYPYLRRIIHDILGITKFVNTTRGRHG